MPNKPNIWPNITRWKSLKQRSLSKWTDAQVMFTLVERVLLICCAALAVCCRLMRQLFAYVGWYKTLTMRPAPKCGTQLPWAGCSWPGSLPVTWPAALKRDAQRLWSQTGKMGQNVSRKWVVDQAQEKCVPLWLIDWKASLMRHATVGQDRKFEWAQINPSACRVHCINPGLCTLNQ